MIIPTTPATDLNDVSGTTGVILASDFSDRVTDNDRHIWTAGKMRHVIAALKGRRVSIVTDNQTGHTLFNVRLVGLTTGMSSNLARVQIEYVYAPGKSQFTNYLLMNIGPCITLMPSATTDKRDKWQALNTWREETSAAIGLYHAHREAEGLTSSYGRYEVRPTANSVVVSFEPDRDRAKRNGIPYGDPRCRFAFREFRMSEVVAEMDRREQQTAAYQAQYEREAAGVPETCEV